MNLIIFIFFLLKLLKINKNMSEIDEDLKISNLEISNNLGLTLSGTNPLIKHSGDGDLNISSNNGNIKINSNNIMFETSNHITLQAASNNIFMNGGFVGNHETLSSANNNSYASLRTLTTFLYATNSSFTIKLGAGQIGQIKKFVFHKRDGETNYTVTIAPEASLGLFSNIILTNPGSTVSLLYTPADAWCKISNS